MLGGRLGEDMVSISFNSSEPAVSVIINFEEYFFDYFILLES